MSGYFSAHNISFGNIFTSPGGLQPLLQEGAYLDTVTRRVEELFKANPTCGSCLYRNLCLGGCRAFGGLSGNGDLLHEDISKCVYFMNDYMSRTDEVFAEIMKETGQTWTVESDALPDRPAGYDAVTAFEEHRKLYDHVQKEKEWPAMQQAMRQADYLQPQEQDI